LACRSAIDGDFANQSLTEITDAVTQCIRRGGRNPAMAPPCDHPDLEKVMPTLIGFNTFAALPEEEISEKQGRRA
jgi:hypothetical protein